MIGLLSDALLLRVDDAARSNFGNVADLESALVALTTEAASEWSGIELEPVVFVGYLADRLEPGSTLEDVRSIRASDLYLAAACSLAIPGAVERLQSSFGPEIAKAIRHMDKTGSLVDDVTQALWVKLLAPESGQAGKIAAFTGKSRLWRWMRVIAVRLAIDLSDADRFAGRLADSQLPDETGDVELDHFRSRYAADFRVAFAEAVEALEPSERTLLKLHLIDRLTIDQLGALHSIHRATAARHLQRARDRLASETLERMRAQLGVERSELDSIMRLIRSRLDVSVGRLLKGDGGD